MPPCVAALKCNDESVTGREELGDGYETKTGFRMLEGALII